MKNNEYNKVKVTNENAKNVPEFVGTPKVESAAYFEAPKAYKDELNSRKTNNDKIEEIGVHDKKKTGFAKQQDYKKVQHGPTHLASTAGHTVVAASTVSVAVIATVVGVSIIEVQEEQDIATFTEANITIDSIEFRIVFPAHVFNEQNRDDPEAPVVETYTEIVAVVANDDYNSDFKDRQMIEEYGPYDPDPDNYYEAWSMWSGLEPDTEYGLYIFADTKMWTEKQEEVIVSTQRLASRTFRTRPIVNTITFSEFVVDSTYVSFAFPVDLSLLEDVSPGDQVSQEQANMFAEISNDDYFDSLYLSDFQWNRPQTVLTCYGDFQGLTPSTSYTLTIYQSRETEYAALGRRTFTTRPVNHAFNSITFEEYTSFYSHSFDVMLDYYDNDNCFSQFELTMIDSQGQTLGVHDLGDVPPYRQTVNIEQTQGPTADDPVWAYDLGDVRNYQLSYFDNQLGSTQYVTGAVTFTDSDISNFLAFDNQEFKYNEAVVDNDTVTYVPFSLSFVDEGHQWQYFTVEIEYEYQDMTQGGGATNTVVFKSTTMDPVAHQYQYATFDYDSTTRKSIGDFDGQTGTAYVYANGNGSEYDDDHESSICNCEIVINQALDWEFFYLGIESFDITDNSGYPSDINLNTVYLVDENKDCISYLCFEDVNTNEIFIYNLTFSSTPNRQLGFTLASLYTTENVAQDSGYLYGSYSELKNTYSGRTFNIYLRYYTQTIGGGDQSAETTISVAEGVQLNFAD